MTMNTKLKPPYSLESIDFSDLEMDGGEENYIFSVDPLILSCVAYRLKNTPTDISNVLGAPAYWSITTDTNQLTNSIKEEDVLLAQNIRNYYSGKIVVKKLRNEQLTRFRKDLSIFLNIDSANGCTISSKFLGMIYKLPYFYEYDLALIDISEGEYRSVRGPTLKTKCQLTFIKKLDTYHKKKTTVEYWFSDEKDNRVMLTIEKRNPLRPLLEYYVEDNILSVTGSFVRAHKDTIEFYNSKHWEFDKEMASELD